MSPNQKISLAEFDLHQSEKYVLSINLKIDGLSFIIIDDQKILFAESYIWQAKNWDFATEQFSEIFKSQEFFNARYSKVTAIVKHSDSTLIPNVYFDKSKQQSALEAYLGRKDFTAYAHALKHEKAMLVFAINLNLEKLLKSCFNSIEIRHQSALLIDEELERAQHDAIIALHISPLSFEVIGIRAKRLLAHNNFLFQSVEEFMFLLLSFVQQNNFKTESLQLNISGNIMMDSKIGQNLKRFFPNIVQDKSSESNKDAVFNELKNLTLLANS